MKARQQPSNRKNHSLPMKDMTTHVYTHANITWSRQHETQKLPLTVYV